MNIFYDKTIGITIWGLLVFVLILFIILYSLGIQKIEYIRNIIYSITGIVIIYTAYQAYLTFKFQANMEKIKFNVTGYQNILDNVDDETYRRWYPDLNGLTIEQHKLMSLIGIEIENANILYKFSDMKVIPKEGWYDQIQIWINDPLFEKYWETDYISYDKETIKLVNKILNEKKLNLI